MSDYRFPPCDCCGSHDEFTLRQFIAWCWAGLKHWVVGWS